MSSDNFRDTMSNIGDILVDNLEKGYIFLKESTSGILKAYNQHVLNKKRNGIIGSLGERLIEVRDGSPGSEIFKDNKLLELFEKLTLIEATIKDYKE